jgi:hypothetical protein
MSGESTPQSRLFWWSAAGALALHAALLAATDGIHGGADLRPHLRLVEQMAAEASLRSVYAPAYHVVGAVVAPLVGFAAFTKLFAFAAAAALIAGFRYFQRAAGLPDVCSALFAWAPYLFALTWCIPKVEAAGYALAFAGLGLVLRKRHLAAAVALCATFFVHTASGLVFGLCGGLVALVQRDARALGALALGTAGAAPLFVAHLAAGCSLAETFLFSTGDYLRPAAGATGGLRATRIAILASPIALVAAMAGAAPLWRRFRAVAVVCVGLFALYWNELWLAPFGLGSTLNLLRGLSLLAFVTAIAGGVALDRRRRLAPFALVGCAALAIAGAVFVVPNACFTRSFTEPEIRSTAVDRCTFRWRNASPVLPDQGDGSELHSGIVDRP